MRSGLKKFGHRSHCSGWQYMVKASPRFFDILKDEEKRLRKKYVRNKKEEKPVYEPTDLILTETKDNG